MERNFRIRASDGKVIEGTLNWRGAQPSRRLLITVHGLVGEQNDHQHFNAARFFPKHGFSVLRFDLYSWKPGCRRLDECTIRTHSSDLERIIQYARRKKFRDVFLVGHSLGGPTILLANLANVRGVVLWDPTQKPVDLLDDVHFDKRSKRWILDWGVKHLLGARMVQEFKSIGDVSERVRAIEVPLKIIAAGKGALVKGCREYHRKANHPKELKVISGAGHCFDEEGTEEMLFRETLKWCKKFSRR